MKYLILVPDGAADRPLIDRNGMTPLEIAETPTIDSLAMKGEVGTVTTIPDGIPPGSDAANLAVMGYDPAKDLTGRSPLEVISMGLDMAPTDVSYRTNLVTLEGSGDYEDLTIVDHGAGDISTEEAEVLIEEIEKQLGEEKLHFYPGVSYRHAMIVSDGTKDQVLTPPHDIVDKTIGEYLPKGPDSEFIKEKMKKSYEILNNHPINIKRRETGMNPANSIWIWGQGTKPELASFIDKFGINGSVISAVDLIKGIGLCAELSSIDVDGATGTLETNYEGKANAAIDEYKKGQDFVYIHVEGPDEASHQGKPDDKIKALEMIDGEILKPVVDYLKSSGEDYRVLIVPDHRTPLEIRTHSSEPVPFIIYDSRKDSHSPENRFTEKSGSTGDYYDSGSKLADHFFKDI